ncbi:MAG: hypothetical protein Q9227_007545 [Pyrenula ochraceoflavens]
MSTKEVPLQGQNAQRQHARTSRSSVNNVSHFPSSSAVQSTSLSDDPALARDPKARNTPKSSQSKQTKQPRQAKARQSSSQSTPNGQRTRQGTPVKAAYAGPTFHSSPAPSALPMPSFLSKSVPEVSSVASKPVHEEDESISESSTSAASTSENNNGAGGPPELVGREPSPLDFLFDAARQARRTPNTNSPPSLSQHLTPGEESPSRRPQPLKTDSSACGTPFELDGAASDPQGIGPSFATPYHERMKAFQASRSQSPINSSLLDEKERKAKTEGLKRLLRNSQLARSASASPSLDEQSSHNNAKAQASTHNIGHRSGPPTPAPSGMSAKEHQHDARTGLRSSQPETPVFHSHSPSVMISPPATGVPRDPLPLQAQYALSRNRFPQYQSTQTTSPPVWSSTSIPTPESKGPPAKIVGPKSVEDDLRRMLRLDN